MTLIQSIILGIIQGASEFLPISSTGHLVLAPFLFGWDISQDEAYIFNVLAQVATLLAVLIYYREDLLIILRSMFEGIVSRKPFQLENSRLGWLLILATIPAGITAVLFKEVFMRAFSSPRTAALSLLITSLLLILGELLGKRLRKLPDMSWLDAILIGLFQVLALFPGISRSGSTITGGLIRNFGRRASARFSFLMTVPVMLATGLLTLVDLFQIPQLFSQLPIYMAGFVSAAIVGYLAIKWFISYLSRQSLYVFAGYCAILGSVMLILINH